MERKRSTPAILLVLGLGLIGYVASQWLGETPSNQEPTTELASSPGEKDCALSILSGSENESLVPLLDRFADKTGARVCLKSLGSVDIMLAMQSGKVAADAVWPASSVWLTIGDQTRRAKKATSIWRMPVVLGLRQSKAQELGWVGRKDVTMAEIMAAAEAGSFKYGVTSATQSNSGANVFLAQLTALAGRADAALTRADLDRAEVRDGVRRYLATVARSAGSSNWLMSLYLETVSREGAPVIDGVFNYEGLIIETNQELRSRQLEPLYVIYPAGAVAVADGTLALWSDDKRAEEVFDKLVAFLTAPDVQKEIQALGRRTGFTLNFAGDPKVFRSEDGVDLQRVLQPTVFPDAETALAALGLYQTALRKPSAIAYVLDFSGSMRDNGRHLAMKDALGLLLREDSARRLMLQPTEYDITIVLPFSFERSWPVFAHIGKAPVKRDAPLTAAERAAVEQVMARVTTYPGPQAAALEALHRDVEVLQPDGGTAMFDATIKALGVLEAAIRQAGAQPDDYTLSIVLLSDGDNRNGMDRIQFPLAFRDRPALAGRDLPIYAILFGDAVMADMKALTEVSLGRIFDAKSDIAKAFRAVRGYN